MKLMLVAFFPNHLGQPTSKYDVAKTSMKLDMKISTENSVSVLSI